MKLSFTMALLVAVVSLSAPVVRADDANDETRSTEYTCSSPNAFVDFDLTLDSGSAVIVAGARTYACGCCEM